MNIGKFATLLYFEWFYFNAAYRGYIIGIGRLLFIT